MGTRVLATHPKWYNIIPIYCVQVVVIETHFDFKKYRKCSLGAGCVAEHVGDARACSWLIRGGEKVMGEGEISKVGPRNARVGVRNP
jgi:hypothetical protein